MGILVMGTRALLTEQEISLATDDELFQLIPIP